jgi:diadenosine tetraphosphate (Ap4A) HIT family hydrolase
MNACPFCPDRIGEGQSVMMENEHCLYIEQPQKVLAGSGIIVPRLHREQVFDLSPDEWQSTHTMLLEVKAMLDERYSPDGYTVGWNNGKAVGQPVFHVHLHVIPRYSDEPFAGRGVRSWIKRAENLRPGHS